MAGVGSASITYDYTDINECNSIANASITIDDCASVDELKNLVLAVYPNPASSIFNVTSNESIHSYALEMIDISGKKVSAESHLKTTSIIEFNIEKSTPGVYFIKGTINDQFVTLTITIQ